MLHIAKRRRVLPRFVYALLFLTCISTACTDDPYGFTTTYTVYEPVYQSWEDMRAAAGVEGPRALNEPGKIWVQGTYLLINERGKGIHVFDNSIPTAPHALAFVAIPGNQDMAMFGNLIYADSYVDLLTIDISVPASPRIVRRLEHAFPYRQFENGTILDSSRGVVVNWNERQVEGNSDEIILLDRPGRGTAEQRNSFSDQAGSGKGGSMAAFCITAGHLYIVRDYYIKTFALDAPATPRPASTRIVGSELETIFPFGNVLLIGSQFGMYLYTIADPTEPRLESVYNHLRSCDPVVAQGNYAYVTLRSGSACEDGTDRLDILDIRNIHYPQLVSSFMMHNPHGLGIRENTLYLCDGKAGLKVFDVNDKQNIVLLESIPGAAAYDVIPYGKRVIVVGADGLRQYDCSNPRALILLSTIPVQ